MVLHFTNLNRNPLFHDTPIGSNNIEASIYLSIMIFDKLYFTVSRAMSCMFYISSFLFTLTSTLNPIRIISHGKMHPFLILSHKH